MNVDGELGLESGNSADDHFILLKPGGGGSVEKSRVFNSGQQRRD